MVPIEKLLEHQVVACPTIHLVSFKCMIARALALAGPVRESHKRAWQCQPVEDHVLALPSVHQLVQIALDARRTSESENGRVLGEFLPT